jgi:hypothetical protein
VSRAVETALEDLEGGYVESVAMELMVGYYMMERRTLERRGYRMRTRRLCLYSWR